jgi:hypothetical protein
VIVAIEKPELDATRHRRVGTGQRRVMVWAERQKRKEGGRGREKGGRERKREGGREGGKEGGREGGR